MCFEQWRGEGKKIQFVLKSDPGVHCERPQIACKWEERWDAKGKKAGKWKQVPGKGRGMKGPKMCRCPLGGASLRLLACNSEEAWGAHGSVLYSYAIYRGMAQPSLCYTVLLTELHCCCWLLVGQFRALEGRQPGNGSTLSSSPSPISSSKSSRSP